MAVFNIGQSRWRRGKAQAPHSDPKNHKETPKAKEANSRKGEDPEIQQARKEMKAAKREERRYEKKAEEKRDMSIMASWFDPLSLTGGGDRSDGHAQTYDMNAQDSKDRGYEAEERLRDLEGGKGY